MIRTDLQNQARVRCRKLMAKLEIEDLGPFLRERLRWFGHVEHSSGAVRTACDIQVAREAKADMEETDRE